MTNFLFYSYLSASVAYSLLFIFTLLNKNRFYPFTLAILISAIWSISVALTHYSAMLTVDDTLAIETLRNASWFFVISFLLSKQQYGNAYTLLLKSTTSYIAIIFILFTLTVECFPVFLKSVQSLVFIRPRILAHELFAVFGLILVEQLFRNTPLQQRSSLKFLCIGLASTFIVDLIVYSKSLLFMQLDTTLWQTRGLLSAAIVPLLAFYATRMRMDISQTDVSQPRRLVFYTTFLLGCCIYLFLMSMAGYYVKFSNLQWGSTVQALFIFLAIVILIYTFTSGKIRSIAKVYFTKHFFHYSYDYRDEWIKISRSLAQLQSLEELQTFILTTLINLVQSSGGGLWLKNPQNQFFLAAEQHLQLTASEKDALNDANELALYLTRKQWVIDFFELSKAPEIYQDVDLTPWCNADSKAWLIIPLFHLNTLEAFAVLSRPKAPRQLDWEDHDLLKTVGMQLANALALKKTSDELSNHRQFETYHRLSAYLVHDLKNLVAQISLIVKNAEKHKHNPDFFDDTIDTLNNVTQKMQRIVEQLKQGSSVIHSNSLINLTQVLSGIEKHHRGIPPVEVINLDFDCFVNANFDKLTNILTNLTQNAQDATTHIDGWVKLTLSIADDYAIIKIVDNGTGMDKQFISERLFKPFDTTKGNAGMGIGAYEAREYVLKQGGRFYVDSTPGQGSTISVFLPLATRATVSE